MGVTLRYGCLGMHLNRILLLLLLEEITLGSQTEGIGGELLPIALLLKSNRTDHEMIGWDNFQITEQNPLDFAGTHTRTFILINTVSKVNSMEVEQVIEHLLYIKWNIGLHS